MHELLSQDVATLQEVHTLFDCCEPPEKTQNKVKAALNQRQLQNQIDEVETPKWIYVLISIKLSTTCCTGKHIPRFLYKHLYKSNTTELTEVKQPVKPFDDFPLLKPLCWFQTLRLCLHVFILS